VRRRRERELVLRPTASSRAAILYHHGYTEPHDRLLRDPDRDVTEALLAAGFLVASSTAGGDSWGSRASVDANHRLWEGLGRPELPLGHLGISMGCLVALNCAADERFPSLAVAGIAPVCDVESVRPHRPVSGDARNPMDLDAGCWAGLSIRFWAAEEEAPVSKARNADAFAQRAAPWATESSVVGCVGNHTSASQYQPADVVRFFLRAFGLASS
jgi:alpha-beta hydrolase superfamily lysophospholipase